MSPASGNKRRERLNCGIRMTSFHSINVPSEWEQSRLACFYFFLAVSIQLMSPASGNLLCTRLLSTQPRPGVSIQLMSPASGNLPLGGDCPPPLWCFHSINVPSEWERICKQDTNIWGIFSFHSINVPSEWEPEEGYSLHWREKEFPFN